MATPNYSLPILTGTETYSLKNIHNTLSNSVDAALKVVSNGGVPRVANSSERNALFPSAVQGNRVFRNDLGWEEGYFALYNSTTNPGGAATSGWYPTAGKLPYASLTRPGAAAITTAQNAFAFSTNRSYQMNASNSAVTVTIPGRYQIMANIPAGNGGGAEVYAAIRKNGSGSGGGGLAFGAASQTGATDFNSIAVSAIEPFAAGDVITFNVWGSTGLATGDFASRMDVQYIGPA